MQQLKMRFRDGLRGGFAAFRAALVPIFVFEILYKAATGLVAKPLLGFVMQLMLGMAGDELAFNDGIWRFALTVPGLLAVVLLLAIAVACVYFEFAVVIYLLRQALAGQAPALKGAAVRGLWSFGSLKSPATPLFALYALFLLPLVNMGITSSLLPQLAIPNFISGELTKTGGGMVLLLVLLALVFVLFCCLLFVLPAMVLERVGFLGAARRSLGALRAYHIKMLGLLLVFVAAWALLFDGPRQAFNFFFGTPSVSLWEAATYYGFSLLSPVMVLIWVVASLLQLCLTPLLLALLTACYLPLAAEQAPGEEALAKTEAWLDRVSGWLQAALTWVGRQLQKIWRRVMAVPFVQKHKKLLAVLLVLVLAWATFNAFYTAHGIHDPIVIGHRGSAYGVENTLEAIQGAIDAGADYTEVDVLLSADGVPMVIHDANLERLSGQDVNVYDLTAAQLGKLELFQYGYTGHISTLQELVEYCEGKILLAVEYKLHGHEQKDLVDAVMAVMTQSDYQKNSIYLSLDFALVRQMRQGYPSYAAGYCVYGNVGQLNTDSLREMDISFLLVEEWMASRDLVRACRKAWLPVYVWTANDPAGMDDYLRMGITGLVADYPDAAMEVLGGMYSLGDRTLPHQLEDEVDISIEDE